MKKSLIGGAALALSLAAVPAFADGAVEGRKGHQGGHHRSAPEPLTIGGLLVAGGALAYARRRSKRADR